MTQTPETNISNIQHFVDIENKSILSAVFVCVPVRFVTLTACSMFESLFVCAVNYLFIGVPMHERLLDLKVQSEKLKLSKNSSPAPSKNKTKTEK